MATHVDAEKYFVKRLLFWGCKNRRSFPWREDRDPFKILIAEMFLQRTPANRVSKSLSTFIRIHANPRDLAAIGPEKLEEIYHSLGLKSRMSRLIESSKIICEKYHCEVPDSYDGLISLPGVGVYTASAILCFGFGHDVSIVDANVHRVLTRFFGLPRNKKVDNDDIAVLASRLVPRGRGIRYNESILDFAALICKPKPLCNICPLRAKCEYFIQLNQNREQS